MNPSGVESGGWANSFAAKLGEGVGRGMISIWRLRRQTSREEGITSFRAKKVSRSLRYGQKGEKRTINLDLFIIINKSSSFAGKEE